MTTAPPAEDRIAAFLSRFSGGHPIGPEDDIFALGVMNSLLAMQLVLFIEQEFGIAVPDEELQRDSFRSTAAMGRLVRRLGGA